MLSDNEMQNSSADWKSHENVNVDEKETSEETSATIPSNIQFVSQSIDAKDSPNCDIVEGKINASQAIRCPPASQAQQKEDSGIESMDALKLIFNDGNDAPQTMSDEQLCNGKFFCYCLVDFFSLPPKPTCKLVNRH